MFFLFPIIKSHRLVMMTFLVFDLDVLFIPCYSFFLSAVSIALPYLKNYLYDQHQMLCAYVGLGYAVQCKISVTSGHFKMSK